MEVKIPVPYKSQYRDLSDKYFALTSCGMVSLHMVLEYFQHREKLSSKLKSLEEMVIEGRATDRGYGPNGWIHQYFVDVATTYDLSSFRKEKIESLDEIIQNLIKENPVVVSVERRCLSGVSFHMVVLVGLITDEQNELTGFYYHDPAALSEEGGAFKYCTKEQFLHFWRAKAIFFS